MQRKSIIFTLFAAALICCVLMFSASAKTVTFNPSDFSPYTVPTKDVNMEDIITNTYTSKGRITKSTFKDTGSDYSNSTTYTYDSKGRLTKKVDAQDSYNSIVTTYAYNSDGNLSKKVETQKSGSSKEIRITTCTYNSNGKLTKVTDKYDEDGDISYNVTKYTYDSKGNLVKEVGGNLSKDKLTIKYSYDSKGSLTAISCVSYNGDSGKKAYNSKGDLISETYKKADGYSYSKKSTYDSNGNLTKYTYTDTEGEKNTVTYTYDAKNNKNNIAKEVETFSDKSTATTTYTYNANGYLTKIVTKYSFGDAFTTIYSYNAKGNLTKKTEKTSEGDTYTTTYSYNSSGNLTKETIEGLHDDAMFTNYKTISGVVSSNYGDYEIVPDYISTTYDGNTKKPGVSILSSVYVDPLPGLNYTITYSNNTNPGKGKIKIDFKGIIDNYYDDEDYYDTIFMGKEKNTIIINFDIKPVAPKSVKTVSSNKSSAKLSWGKVTGAAKYEIYKYIASSKKYTKVATVTGTSATIKNLKANTKYQFCVRAVTKDGVNSAMSAKVTASTYSAAPKAPTSLKTTAKTSTSITFSWKSSANTTNYEVYKYVVSSKKYTKVATVTGTSATVKGLKKNTKYMFCVKAVNNAGKSAYSSKLSVTTKK